MDNVSSISADLAKVSGALSSTRRWKPETDVTDLRRETDALRIARYAAEVVATAPPFTDAQIDRIISVLRSGGAKA